MALGFGANARFLAAFESDYGVPSATGWTAVQLSRHGLSAKQNLLANDLLGLGRDPAPPVPGAVSVDGEVGVPTDARAMGFWLKALLGEPASAGTGPYTHTFVSGAPLIPSLSIQAANPDVPLFRTHLGVRLDKATFRLERDGLPGATLSLIAKGEVTDSDFRAASPAQHSPLRFGPLHGQIRKDGQPLGRVVAAEIGYANTLDRIETIRSDGMIDGAEPTAAACTGSITVRFDGTALFEAATTGTPVALDFGYLRDASTSLLIAVHEAWLSRPGLAIEGPAGIQATFEFQGARNAALGRMATVTLTNDVEGYV